MSTLKQADPCADVILDFIAGGVALNPSGESDGNYDAVIGNAHSTRDLNVLTLQQIYDLQTQLVASGEPSSAIGRYQFIKSTLQVVAKALKLTTSSVFTEAVEDQLTLQLLNSACSFQGWRSGTVTDQAFAHLLSLQWASLPDPQNGGKSHYDGVGPNHAGTSLANVYSMLKSARAALSGPIQVAPNNLPTDDDIRTDIWRLQTKFAARGYYVGEIDGWGAGGTQHAMAAFVLAHPGRLTTVPT